jgi:nitrite reductase/ring-hydroxylating ferredoxin subunit
VKTYYPVLKLSELPLGKGVKINIRQKEIALFRRGEKVIAVQNRCPHQNADLALGYVKENKLYCYLHHWAFDIYTGAYAFNPGMYLNIYDVKIENDLVLIGLDD